MTVPRRGCWPNAAPDGWSNHTRSVGCLDEGQCMLRRLDLKRPWRSLDKGFWPDDLPLGCRTIVYGHNGSGKSTLAELLMSLAEDDCATEVVWGGRRRAAHYRAPWRIQPIAIHGGVHAQVG